MYRLQGFLTLCLASVHEILAEVCGCVEWLLTHTVCVCVCVCLCVCVCVCVLSAVKRALHGTQYTQHTLKHILPQRCNTYNDVFLLINSTKV